MSIWRSTVLCIDCWLSINIATLLFTCLTLPQLFCIHNNTLVALQNVLIRFKVILYLITCYFSGYMLPFSVIWIRLIAAVYIYEQVEIWRKKRVEERQYETSYKWIVEKAKQGYLYKIFGIFGPKYRKLMFVLWQFIYTTAAMLIGYSCFHRYVLEGCMQYHVDWVYLQLLKWNWFSLSCSIHWIWILWIKNLHIYLRNSVHLALINVPFHEHEECTVLCRLVVQQK